MKEYKLAPCLLSLLNAFWEMPLNIFSNSQIFIFRGWTFKNNLNSLIINFSELGNQLVVVENIIFIRKKTDGTIIF